ncbi:MAG: UDP-N-acetylglucosamine 2-epimerase (non-hydrolyzing) [Deltaproteobacteria bacterium]|nr:UDP-N-acetylglucosamine 2-epimerase (non-hydrolyzing) [Deltaproteobacteria bacterium]
MRVLTVVGARPQLVKCAVVSRVLRKQHQEILIHTGQHYDDAMSALFFRQLEIPEPDENLDVRSGSHGEMTARMMERLERSVLTHRPDWVLVYGDTNSTLAGALVAAKLQVPVAHVEAGLRSFNRRMPEEINRVVTDHLASLLLCPTDNAVALLAREGITRGVHNVGDVMLDSVLQNAARARTTIDLDALLGGLGFQRDPSGAFAFATLHRAENTDDPARLERILLGLAGCPVPVLLPLHPRTRKMLEGHAELRAQLTGRVHLVEPIGYLELLAIVSSARLVLTDSGGLQKEALFLGTRCITLRDETEWVETIDAGANVLAGADTGRIVAEAERALAQGPLGVEARAVFGDGRAGEKIVEVLEREQHR